MYSLMVVDDEEIILNGISDVVRASGLPLRTIQTAGSAREAMELLEISPCDILLTDIRMPDMDGLEMVRRAKEIWPDIRVIFLTGYQDFEYARAALRLDSDDFLVKPASDGKLLEAIERVIVTLDKTWMARFLSRDKSGSSWEDGDDWSGEKEIRLIFLKIDTDSARIREDEIWEGLRSMLERVLKPACSRVGFGRCRGNYVLRLLENQEEDWEEHRDYDGWESACEPGRSLRQEGKDAFHSGIRVRRVLEEVQSFFLEQLDIGMSIGISEKGSITEEADWCARWEEMCGEGYGKLLLMGEGNGDAEAAQGNFAVHAIQAYVKENPEKDLSLGALAERFRMNPSYLSRIFSREMGQPLSEYILNVRIELARKLLWETEMKVYEIAEKTGFGTPGYFTKVFRRIQGISPKAYRMGRAAGEQK